MYHSDSEYVPLLILYMVKIYLLFVFLFYFKQERFDTFKAIYVICIQSNVPNIHMDFPGGTSIKEPVSQSKRHKRHELIHG